jgi:FlaA1/EpsC-like NDP-sugar epimerase
MFWFIAITVVVAYLTYYFILWKSCKPRFDGKTIFITGGSSGIGEQLCKRFV